MKHITANTNEKILSYKSGSKERKLLKAELNRQIKSPVEIPVIINGEEIKTGNTSDIKCPNDHKLSLGKYHRASSEEIRMAIEGALKVKEEWVKIPKIDKAKIFLKAADLLAGPYRQILNAATMLGQGKTVIQAEIDSACELIDFWRLNAQYMMTLEDKHELIQDSAAHNMMEFRPLEGFVLAIAPFNFTAIAGNLASAPAIMGNVVVLKPSSNSVLSTYYIMKILKEAGLPDGVINFVPSQGKDIAATALNHRSLAGVHFTGSTKVFSNFWQTIGNNLAHGKYKTYPRIVGETGGKDFILAAPDAEIDSLTTALVRGSFEYQGQKCSAASRAYIPKSIWPEVEKKLKKDISEIKVGDVCDFQNFMGAVIDKNSFKKITSYIEDARKSPDAEIVAGGTYDDTVGYFVNPTVILAKKPDFKTMKEEIFGPVLTIHVYNDKEFEYIVNTLDKTSPYALTGSIFSKNRNTINFAKDALRNAAGNFYINDKPTGAVVGQQPFGGARMSGTNDKAGSYLNLLRWASPRTIKENFTPPKDFQYPYMTNK
jgi:1-pyrroline-5-carboxylate dehydrogenase